MELLGAQKCFEKLKKEGIDISSFTSDRHLGIAKWIRTNERGTQHFYDTWHVIRSICKKVINASKEKGMELLQKWVKGIRRHMYWCVLSTKQGFGALIAAKWESIMGHVAGKHYGHENPLFPQCAHGELERRKFIKIGELQHSLGWYSKFESDTSLLNLSHLFCF